jgi:hypothetical protein
MDDKTWDMKITVRIKTMCGWTPIQNDIEGWLADSGLELVSVEDVQEVKVI